MNKARQLQLNKLAESLRGLLDDLEQLRSEEQEYFDAMPESIQSGDRGEQAEQTISDLDEAVEALLTAADLIEGQ